MSHRMEKHVTAVGLLHIGLGALHVLGAMLLFVAVAGGSLLSGEITAILVGSTLGAVLAGFLVLTGLPGIVGGLGLLGRRRWARWVVLVVAALNLLEFPLGTALAAYSFWALLSPESRVPEIGRAP